MASLNLRAQLSPDTKEIFRQASEAIDDIIAADMEKEPRATGLSARFQAIFDRREVLDVEHADGMLTVSICSDEMLKCLAELQALRRVAIRRIEERKRR